MCKIVGEYWGNSHTPAKGALRWTIRPSLQVVQGSWNEVRIMQARDQH